MWWHNFIIIQLLNPMFVSNNVLSEFSLQVGKHFLTTMLTNMLTEKKWLQTEKVIVEQWFKVKMSDCDWFFSVAPIKTSKMTPWTWFKYCLVTLQSDV